MASVRKSRRFVSGLFSPSAGLADRWWARRQGLEGQRRCQKKMLPKQVSFLTHTLSECGGHEEALPSDKPSFFARSGRKAGRQTQGWGAEGTLAHTSSLAL